ETRPSPAQDPRADARELAGDERRHGGAEMSVPVRQRADKDVACRKALQNSQFAYRAEPILLRVGVTTIADVSALALDGGCGTVPGEPTINIGEAAQLAQSHESPHARCQK